MYVFSNLRLLRRLTTNGAIEVFYNWSDDTSRECPEIRVASITGLCNQSSDEEHNIESSDEVSSDSGGDSDGRA